MTPKEPLRDIMRRTMYNLDFIKQQATREGPYEVTQLVNSFLGALAHPWEQFKRELMSISLADAENQGWPHVVKEFTTDNNPRNLGGLLRLVRNGMAHGNIEFQPGEDGEIYTIRVWNIDPETRTRTWGTIFTVEQMRVFLDCFVKLAEQLHDRQNYREEQIV